MSRKIERVFRDRPLAPVEVANDERVRHDVKAEFPPVVSATEIPQVNLSDPNSEGQAEHLRDWLSASEKSLREVWDNEEDAAYDTQ